MFEKLKGFKTYIAAGLAAVVAFLAALGKIDGAQSDVIVGALDSIWQVLTALALIFMRSSNAKTDAKIDEANK